ncbi:MAG: tetratricopeptide repeat protein [Aphanocapsa sp. GSE-SYN-MK-11-07L]|jgi:tetratricopeptide (TPR) repeat protein|nr:tetratricopeptide repeat protein [Aphanocapsa sp. GSE-SYN-MK-11-07L]
MTQPPDLVDRLSNTFDPSRPLPPSDQFYVDCHAVRGNDNILRELGRKIERSDQPTCQLYTGHRGVGKTTELLRLKQALIQAWLDEPNQKPDLLADLLIQQGVLFSISRRYVAAIASYDQALKIKPDKPEIWFNRGNALGILGRYEEAIASYDETLKTMPDKHEAWFNRGIALYELGRYEEATVSYDYALKLRQNDQRVLNHRKIIVLDKLEQH